MKVEMNTFNARYPQTKSVESKVEKVPNEPVKVESKSKEITEKDAQKIKDTVDKMNNALKNGDRSIKFKVHESQEGGLNRVSIKVVERESEKVIIEIPSEESIEFSEKLDEITGLLFDHSR